MLGCLFFLTPWGSQPLCHQLPICSRDQPEVSLPTLNPYPVPDPPPITGLSLEYQWDSDFLFLVPPLTNWGQ